MQIIYLIRVYFPKNIKNSYNSIEKKKKKEKNPTFKMGRGTEKTFSQREQMANRYMKRCSTTSCHGNTNQNNNEIPPYICQNGYHEKDKR